MALPAGLGDTDTLRIDEIDDDIVLVTLHRPERMNAISTALISDLDDVVRAVDLDPNTRAIILTGAGKGFCAGADLQGTGDPAPGAEGTSSLVGSFLWQDHLATLHEHIHRSRKPWIAAVNGAAVGGGFAMSLACDIRIAAASARFGAVFIKVGVSNCDMGTSYFLPAPRRGVPVGGADAHRAHLRRRRGAGDGSGDRCRPRRPDRRPGARARPARSARTVRWRCG